MSDKNAKVIHFPARNKEDQPCSPQQDELGSSMVDSCAIAATTTQAFTVSDLALNLAQTIDDFFDNADYRSQAAAEQITQKLKQNLALLGSLGLQMPPHNIRPLRSKRATGVSEDLEQESARVVVDVAAVEGVPIYGVDVSDEEALDSICMEQQVALSAISAYVEDRQESNQAFLTSVFDWENYSYGQVAGSSEGKKRLFFTKFTPCFAQPTLANFNQAKNLVTNNLL
jgi:hypothetical protein